MIYNNKEKLSKLWYFLATGFGIGIMSNQYVPIGTISSLVAIPIWWMILYFYSYEKFLIFLTFATIISIYCCNKANKIIGVHDHKSIVLDEFIGMWITLTTIPTYSCWIWVLFAFLLFRIFDIIKPWPISWCDSTIKNGFGIVLDDIFAGILSICILFILMKIF